MWHKLEQLFVQPCCFPCGKSSDVSVRVELARPQHPNVSQQQQQQQQQQQHYGITHQHLIHAPTPQQHQLRSQLVNAPGAGAVVASASPAASHYRLPQHQPIYSGRGGGQVVRLPSHTPNDSETAMSATHRLYGTYTPASGYHLPSQQQQQQRHLVHVHRPSTQPWAGAPRAAVVRYRAPAVSGMYTLPRHAPAGSVSPPPPPPPQPQQQQQHASLRYSATASTLPHEFRSLSSSSTSSAAAVRMRSPAPPVTCSPQAQPPVYVQNTTVAGYHGGVAAASSSSERTAAGGSTRARLESAAVRASEESDMSRSGGPGAASTGAQPSAVRAPQTVPVNGQHWFPQQQQQPIHCPQWHAQQTMDGGGGVAFISDLKAGDLLGRSNQQLTQLLLQLRRQNSGIVASQQRTRLQLAHETRELSTDSPSQRQARLQSVERCKLQLIDLDRKLETTRPLIKLVDNMLKLSALSDSRLNHQGATAAVSAGDEPVSTANCGPQQTQTSSDWRHSSSQPLMNSTYADIGGLDSQRLRHQQQALQQELCRVKGALYSSAKNLEATVAENARLERDMRALQQQLHMATLRAHNTAQVGQNARSGPVQHQQEVQRLRCQLDHVHGLMDRLNGQQPACEDPNTTASAAGGLETDVDALAPPPPPPAPHSSSLPLYVDTYSSHQEQRRQIRADQGSESPPSPAPCVVYQRHAAELSSSFIDADTSDDQHTTAATAGARAGSSSASLAVGDGCDDRSGVEKLSLDSGLNSASPSDAGPSAHYQYSVTESGGRQATEADHTAASYYTAVCASRQSEQQQVTVASSASAVNSVEGGRMETVGVGITAVRPLTAYSQHQARRTASCADLPAVHQGGVTVAGMRPVSSALDVCARSAGGIGGVEMTTGSLAQQRVRSAAVASTANTLTVANGLGAHHLHNNYGNDKRNNTRSNGVEQEQANKMQYGIVAFGKEKPLEIKTVRIVKRESQLRQKDKWRRGGCDEAPSVGENDKFQRSMSLPRSYERAKEKPASASVIRGRIPGFRHQLLKKLVDKSGRSRLTAHQRLFGSNPSLTSAAAGGHLSVNFPPNPAVSSAANYTCPSQFRSDAARQIAHELAATPALPPAPPAPPPLPPACSGTAATCGGRRRQYGQQHSRARRHHTISGSRPAAHQQLNSALASFHAQRRRQRPLVSAAAYVRSVDDMDAAQNGCDRTCSDTDTPDVVKSSLSRVDPRYDETTIDSLLGAPNKIHIPERYVPELQVEQLSEAERVQRSQKAASIRKMLSHSTGFLETIGKTDTDGQDGRLEAMRSLLPSVGGEQKQREHLLHMNQILARQVTERSKQVAVMALANAERVKILRRQNSPPPVRATVQQRESCIL